MFYRPVSLGRVGRSGNLRRRVIPPTLAFLFFFSFPLVIFIFENAGMGNQMIDWRAQLFWQNTDTDTAGCLSGRRDEWCMSIWAQNKAKKTKHPHRQGERATSFVSVLTHYLRASSISKNQFFVFYLLTVDYTHMQLEPHIYIRCIKWHNLFFPSTNLYLINAGVVRDTYLFRTDDKKSKAELTTDMEFYTNCSKRSI